MAQTYEQWLKAKGLTSTRANAKKWRAGQAPSPRTPRARPAPFSYADQIARDPLSVPYGSDIIWQGKQAPNLGSLAGRGYQFLTPVERPGGGFAVFGQKTDPTPQWMTDMRTDIRTQGQKGQQYAMQQVAPWLDSSLAALSGASGQAQTNFANAIGSMAGQQAQAAGAAGPGAAYRDSAALAPFQHAEQTSIDASTGMARADAGAASYQAALATMQQNTGAQGLQSGLAQSIARMPNEWQQQEQAFMRSMAPILAQISQQRTADEQARMTALEQRRQFNENNRVERSIAGLNNELDQRKLDADIADTAHDNARQDAQDANANSDFRTLQQIRGDLTAGQTVLDNQGKGFSSRPKIKRYHGREVTWEQTRSGAWVGVVSKKGGGAAAGGGNGGDNVYANSNTAKRLKDELLSRWNGDPADPATPGSGTPGWRDAGDPGGGTNPNMARAQRGKLVASWIWGNRQFFMKGGKLRDADVRDFLQSVIPDLDYRWVRHALRNMEG